MLRKRVGERDESTYVVPGKAPDEVVSGWSVNLRVCMPSTVRTRNKRLIVADPLGKSELLQRDHPTVYWAGKDRAALTRRVVKEWAAPLGKPAVVALELQPSDRPAGQLCAASDCDNVCGRRALCGGSFVGLCDAHLAEQRVGGSAKGESWSVDGRCVGCWSAVDAADSWLLSSGHRAC